MDVKLAYLHGVLEEEIYMEQPEGFIAQGEEDKVCRLVHSLYGLKQAGWVWNRTFAHTIKRKLGFNTIHSDAVMGLPIRYPPVASYFWLSIIFLTLQILRHPPCWHNLLRPSCDHHRLYPIPHCTIGPVPHRRPPIWPTDHVVIFSFLSLFPLPDAFCCGLTDHRLSHCTIRTLPYVLLHTNLVLVLLIICI